MQELIIGFMNQFGYFGIAFLIAIENIFPPIPSEVILTFGGFMTLSTKLSILGVIVAATIGAVVGAVALYMIGRFFNKERLFKIIDGRLGKILHLKRGDIEKADAWFDKRGKWTVFFCRFVPIIRSLISIPAGMSEMKFSTFLILTTIGTSIWNIVLVLLGVQAGESWPSIVEVFNSYSHIGLYLLIGLLVISVGLFYYFRIFKNKKAKKSSS